jgi:hypothetical protein
VKQALEYLAVGALSFLLVTVLERFAAGLEWHLMRTELYSIYGFSHIFFGIGLSSAILFFRPKLPARVVILVVLIVGIAWELHEGYWLRGEPIDSLEDVTLAILSASTFLCFTRSKDGKRNSTRSPDSRTSSHLRSRA